MTRPFDILSTTLAVGQSASVPQGGSGLLVALVVTLVAACVVALWAVLRLTRVSRQVATMRVEQQTVTEAHRALLERERQQSKSLDERRGEVTQLKQELAAQKKKNHGLQEEAKKLRAAARREIEALERARKSRPAFEERAPEPGPVPVKPAPKAAAPQAAAPAPAPAPAPTAEAAPAPEAAVDTELAQRAAALEEENRALGEKVQSERRAAREAREELKRLRKRVESMRRIDLVSKGKIEILEDKLAALGRQHYEAVSELAAIKGEVRPPPPRDLRPAGDDDLETDAGHEDADELETEDVALEQERLEDEDAALEQERLEDDDAALEQERLEDEHTAAEAEEAPAETASPTRGAREVVAEAAADAETTSTEAAPSEPEGSPRPSEHEDRATDLAAAEELDSSKASSDA